MKQRIVVTMTTIPSRINHIYKTIKSLFNQTLQPDLVYLHLPQICKKENKPYTIPDMYLNYPGLIINQPSQDYGPITKLVPVFDLEKEDETLIIQVDDDVSYPPTFIDTIVRGCLGYNCAVGFSGYIVGSIFTYMGLVRSVDCGLNHINVDYLQGVHGICYKRKFFDSDILNYKDAPYKPAFLMDDVWIGGYLCKKGIDRLVIKGELPYVQDEIASINGISTNMVKFILNHCLIIIWFKKQGAFTCKQRAKFFKTIGSYFLLGFIFIILLIFVIISIKKVKK